MPRCTDTHDPAAMACGWSDDGIAGLWLLVLSQGVRDATARVTHAGHGNSAGTHVTEQADARAFLTDAARLGDVCDALGVNVTWVQAQLRRAYPQIWEEAG